jgi:Flp pilus assembly protein TadG
MNRVKDESGQALIITALCMTCLFGFAALATDVGVMLREKRLLQIAADSAAIAGALELNYNPGNVTAAAQAAAAQNGFASTTSGVTTANGVTVTVNKPPLYGPNAGKAGYVEVIASQKQSTLFMALFGVLNMTPTVRAVAQNGGSSNGCVYVLSPNASPAMDLQGSFDVSAPSCGIIVDSNAAGALNFTGGGGTLKAASVGVVGTATGHTEDSTPAPVQGIVAQSDPFASLVTPDPTKITPACSAPSGGKLTGTIGPAVAGGTVCYSGNVAMSNVTMNAGTYVFTGNVALSGAITSAAAGTTLDINNGALSIGTGTTLNLIAPTSGTYNGIALMQPASNTNQITIQKGDATGSIFGIIYAPGAELFLQDSGGGKGGGLSLTTNLIVGTLVDKTATLTITSYSQTVTTSPLTKVTLVE